MQTFILSLSIIATMFFGVENGLSQNLNYPFGEKFDQAAIFVDWYSTYGEEMGFIEYPYEVPILSSNYKGRYSRTVVKRDIVWIDDEISITKPLLTNGGNVLIFADKLHISAPIDTRIWIDHKGNHFLPDKRWPENDPRYRYSMGDKYFERVPRALEAFEDYYYYSESYNPDTKRYEYSKISKRVFKKRIPGQDKSFNIARRQFPRLPDGGTPPVWEADDIRNSQGVRGEDAPIKDLIKDNIKSGNITIYANEITLCSNCRLQGNPPHYVTEPFPFGSDRYQPPYRAFLNVSGIHGGLGGAGSGMPCPFENPLRYCNALVDRRGGLSGRPGPPGDAGHIKIHFINNRDQHNKEKKVQEHLELFKQCIGKCSGPPTKRIPCFKDCSRSYPPISGYGSSLIATSAFKGGVGQKFVYKTGSYRELKAAASRSAFYPAGLNGAIRSQDGSFKLFYRNTDQALTEVALELSQMDFEGRYSYLPFLRKLEDGGFLGSLSPDGQLVDYLTKVLSKLQTSLLTQVITDLTSDGHSISLPKCLSSLSCDESKWLGINKESKNILRYICNFRPIPGLSPLRSYFYRNGGLFRLENPNPEKELKHSDLLTNISQINTTLREVLVEMTKTRKSFYDYMTLTMKAEYGKRIDSMRQRIIEAEAIASEKGFDKLVNELGTIGQQTQLISEAYKSNRYDKMASAVYDLGKILLRLMGIEKEKRPDIFALKKELSEMIYEYEGFLEIVKETKILIMRKIYINIEKLLYLQTNYAKRIQSVRFLYDDVLRKALMWYIKDAFDSLSVAPTRGTLKKNIQGINNMINKFPDEPVQFFFGSFENLCGIVESLPLEEALTKPEVLSCIRSRPESQSYAILTKPDPKEPIPDIPLYLVRGGLPSTPLPMYQILTGTRLTAKTLEY